MSIYYSWYYVEVSYKFKLCEDKSEILLNELKWKVHLYDIILVIVYLILIKCTL